MWIMLRKNHISEMKRQQKAFIKAISHLRKRAKKAEDEADSLRATITILRMSIPHGAQIEEFRRRLRK